MDSVDPVQLGNLRCRSLNGLHPCLHETCQAWLGSQFDGSQDLPIAGLSCCLTSKCQAMTWDNDGALVLSPSPIGLVDWTSLFRDVLSECVVQSVGQYY